MPASVALSPEARVTLRTRRLPASPTYRYVAALSTARPAGLLKRAVVLGETRASEALAGESPEVPQAPATNVAVEGRVTARMQCAPVSATYSVLPLAVSARAAGAVKLAAVPAPLAFPAVPAPQVPATVVVLSPLMRRMQRLAVSATYSLPAPPERRPEFTPASAAAIARPCG